MFRLPQVGVRAAPLFSGVSEPVDCGISARNIFRFIFWQQRPNAYSGADFILGLRRQDAQGSAPRRRCDPAEIRSADQLRSKTGHLMDWHWEPASLEA